MRRARKCCLLRVYLSCLICGALSRLRLWHQDFKFVCGDDLELIYLHLPFCACPLIKTEVEPRIVLTNLDGDIISEAYSVNVDDLPLLVDAAMIDPVDDPIVFFIFSLIHIKKLVVVLVFDELS